MLLFPKQIQSAFSQFWNGRAFQTDFVFSRKQLIKQLLQLPQLEISSVTAELVASEVEKRLLQTSKSWNTTKNRLTGLVIEVMDDLGINKPEEEVVHNRVNTPVKSPILEKSETQQWGLPREILEAMSRLSKADPFMAAKPSTQASSKANDEEGEFSDATQVLKIKTQVASEEKVSQEKESPKVKPQSKENQFEWVAMNLASMDLKYEPMASLEERQKLFFDLLNNDEVKIIWHSDPSEKSVPQNHLDGDEDFFSLDSKTPVGFVVKSGDESVFDLMKTVSQLKKKYRCPLNFGLSEYQASQTVKTRPGLTPVALIRLYQDTFNDIVTSQKSFLNDHFVISIEHPDILNVIEAVKSGLGRGLNLSFDLSSAFMTALRSEKDYALKGLVDSAQNTFNATLNSADVFHRLIDLVENSNHLGLGFIFSHHIAANKSNYADWPRGLATFGASHSLYSGEFVLKALVNLSRLSKDGEIDWEKLGHAVREGVHLLDNALDLMDLPIVELKEVRRQNRKVALGLCGFDELVSSMGLSLQSNDSLRLARKLMQFIQTETQKVSLETAIRRGSYLRHASLEHFVGERKGRHLTIHAILAEELLSQQNYENSSPEFILRLMASFQGYVDDGVGTVFSKTKIAANKALLAKLVLQAFQYRLHGIAFTS